MFKVNLIFHEGHLILRAGPAELLIIAEHVAELRKLTATHEFAAYFRDQALVNRPARKLFDAWLRKEQGLWQHIYQAVHKSKIPNHTPHST